MSAKAKVGEGIWAMRGVEADGNRWVIIGAPTPGGKRWLTVAQEGGGPTVAHPEAEFHATFHRID